MAAGLCQRLNIHAGAQVDDLDAVFIALDNAGDQVGAVDGGNDDEIIAHIGHGHQGIQLGLGIALGGAGLHVDGDTQLLGGSLVAGLHVGPEGVGERDDHRADLLVAGGGGNIAELRAQGLIDLRVKFGNNVASFFAADRGVVHRGLVIAAGDQAEYQHQGQQQCQKLFHTSFFLQNNSEFIYKGLPL